MEERGREAATVTSRRRKGAGRGSRECGAGGWRAVVWEAASPERAAASRRNIVYFWQVSQDMHPPGRLPQPNDSRPVPSQGFLERGLGRKGSPLPRPHAWLSRSRLASALPLACSYSSWHWLSPSPRLYTSAGPVPKPGREVGGPGSARDLCSSLRPPL